MDERKPYCKYADDPEWLIEKLYCMKEDLEKRIATKQRMLEKYEEEGNTEKSEKCYCILRTYECSLKLLKHYTGISAI